MKLKLLGVLFGFIITQPCTAMPFLKYVDVNDRSSDEPQVSVRLVLKADYLALPVTLTSTQGDPRQRNADLNEALRLVVTAAREGRLRLDMGVLSLSARKGKFLGPRWDVESEARFHLLAPLDAEHDVYGCAEEMTQFINGINLPSKTKVSIGKTVLVMENVHRHREELLNGIAGDVKKARLVFDPRGKVVVSGLESPVLIRQVNEEQVELFLRYTLSVESGGKKIME